MQKVISINISSKPRSETETRSETEVYSEHEFPQLNKLLAEGYVVVNVYQIAPSPSLYCSTITFVLQKEISR